MHRDRITRLIMALVLVAAMLAIILVVGVWMYISVQPAPAATPVPAADSGELTTSEDLRPDQSKLFAVHDGVLTDAEGRCVALEDFRGETVALLFWSSWCSDCKDYFAGEFSAAYAAAEAAGARLILAAREGVRGESRQTAEDCLDAYGFTCGTMMDPDAVLFKTLGLRSVPSLVILDDRGVLMYATSDMPNAQEMTAMLDYARGGAARQTEGLIASMTDLGGVASSCVVEADRLALHSAVLSETQGLMLEYALAADRQPLFDYTMTYVRNSMTRSGLCAWQTDDGKMADVNASLDDLRILHGLIRAEKAWGGYGQEISYREQALYTRCVRDGWMRDFASLTGEQTSADVTLCYQDVAAMRALGDYRPAWHELADRAEAMLSHGLISADFPLYWPRYLPEDNSFTGQVVQMNEAMVTVLNAARAGVSQEATLDWLQARLAEGYIPGAYTLQGEPAAGYEFESTATYALLVQIGLETGRSEMARMALQEMERMRCFTAPLTGGYGHTDGMMLYTFDLVQAMLAWQRWLAQ